MREGALPSPVNAARVLHEVVALGKRENYRVNLIEAYDQPWKRKLEGTVGGHWGLFDAYERKAKFAWGGAVSNHPNWRWQAAGGVGFAALVFAAALAAVLAASAAAGAASGLRVGGQSRLVSGTLIGWTIKNVPIESLYGDRLDALAGLGGGRVRRADRRRGSARGGDQGCRALRSMLGRRAGVPRDPLAFALGALLIVLVVLAVQAALGLVFNPRYRDFPFTALTGGGHPVCRADDGDCRGARTFAPNAETVAAAALVLCAVYIALSETFANWQALWFCAGLARAGGQSVAGAGRARLRMSSAAASPARSVLCSTSPKPAAAIAIDISTIDGRTRLSTAAASATHPNTP